MEKEVTEALAEELAKVLPRDILIKILGGVIEKAISSFSWQASSLEGMVRDAVTERARELLRTKYKEGLDKQAEGLAIYMVGEIARMQLRERR